MLKTKPIRFNRIIALLLSLIMLFGVLPFSASAEEDYGIAICGTMLTPSNYEEFLENYCLGQIAYDPSTNTLTFSGFMRSVVGNTPVVSYYGKDTVNVVLKWGNHVSGIFFESVAGMFRHKRFLPLVRGLIAFRLLIDFSFSYGYNFNTQE